MPPPKPQANAPPLSPPPAPPATGDSSHTASGGAAKTASDDDIEELERKLEILKLEQRLKELKKSKK